jgi:hypothetical protein
MTHRTLTLAILLLLASAVFVCPRLCAPTASAKAEPLQQRRARARRRTPTQRSQPRADYTKFSHRTSQHQQESCDSCHTIPTRNWTQARDREAAFPDVTDYPQHASCINCHRRQFFSGARPAICSVCHTVVSPRAGGRHPFENPSESFVKSEKGKKTRSEFALNFPHDRHQDVMAEVMPSFKAAGGAAFIRASYEPQGEKKSVDSCSICHQTYEPAGEPPSEYVSKPPGELPKNELRVEAFWLKTGMLKTTPSSHASCFNCHWQEGGERPLSSDCAACHKLLPPGQSAASKPAQPDADASNPSAKGITDVGVFGHWMQRRVARFRHEQSDHMGKGCTTCHVGITAASKINADTLFVPITTCSSSSCHGGTKKDIFKEIEQRKKPDGANFQCAKCHINYGKEPTPKSHTDMFPPSAK